MTNRTSIDTYLSDFYRAIQPFDTPQAPYLLPGGRVALAIAERTIGFGGPTDVWADVILAAERIAPRAIAETFATLAADRPDPELHAWALAVERVEGDVDEITDAWAAVVTEAVETHWIDEVSDPEPGFRALLTMTTQAVTAASALVAA